MPWTQLGLLYLAGTAASIWINEDISSILPSRWLRIPQAEEAETFDLEGDASRPSTPPPLYRSQSDDHSLHSHPAGRSSSRFSSLFSLSLVPFLPLVLQMVLSPLSAPDFRKSCAYLPASLRASVCPLVIPSTSPRTVDLVIAYYDEDFDRTREHIANLRASPFVAAREQRVIIYNKGPQLEPTLRTSLNLTADDEVVPLPNLGREGATYLSVRFPCTSFLPRVQSCSPRKASPFRSTSSSITTRPPPASCPIGRRRLLPHRLLPFQPRTYAIASLRT